MVKYEDLPFKVRSNKKRLVNYILEKIEALESDEEPGTVEEGGEH